MGDGEASENAQVDRFGSGAARSLRRRLRLLRRLGAGPLHAPDGAVALKVIDLWRERGEGALVIFESEQCAERIAAIVHAFCPESGVMALPRWDVAPLDPMDPSRRVMGRRMSVLRRLAANGSAPPLVLASPEALLQRVPPPAVAKGSSLSLQRGDALEAGEISKALEARGYFPGDRVDEPGEFAAHGQTIDIFPAGALGPVRIDHADGAITMIHFYDPQDQRNAEATEEVWIDAASEITPLDAAGRAVDRPPGSPGALVEYYGAGATVFDYLGRARIFVEEGADKRVRAFHDRVQEAIAYRDALGERLSSTSLYLGQEEWTALLGVRRAAVLSDDDVAGRPIAPFAREPSPRRALRRFVSQTLSGGRALVFAAADAHDAKALITAAGQLPFPARSVTSWREIAELQANEPATILVDLKTGFEVASGPVVIAAADLLGSRAMRVTPMALAGHEDAVAAQLHSGDIVVHEDHGVAMLRGLAPGAQGAGAGEMLALEFAGEARLLAPVKEIGRVWRYAGAEAEVALDKLYGHGWQARRKRVEEELGEVAASLVARVAERASHEAPRLVPPQDAYETFAGRFPYNLTSDQALAIEACLADLASGRRMDRLVLGDVGFGKTEVALRAAAAAALSGKQVCVVAPTTLLARQHATVFRRRFAGFGLRVASLSRLTNPAETRAVKAELAEGDVRVVVGTHALLGKGVTFADLGLLVIDEEHRFGARQKEKLRRLAADVHTLTMSATPIPRSLASALAGLQEISTLRTPPARRLPVRTIVEDFGDDLVRRALRSERRRNGQSFVIAPRIEEIAPLADKLAGLVPELTIRTVHGRTPAAELDDAMMSFGEGACDILLATNVVESGLDLPRANTIIVARPDQFGLAQLHQLRGRVGRGAARGFAFFLSSPGQKLTRAARKRLETLVAHQELGAGAAISAKDLDIRGFGDLLGSAQSGHVKLLGPALYRRMLLNAMAAARGEQNSSFRPEIEAPFEAFIPDDYVQNPDARLDLYLRLERSSADAGIDELRSEIEERFGGPPQEVIALFDLKRLALACAAHGVTRLSAGPKGVSFEFVPERAPDPAMLRDVGARVADTGRVVLPTESPVGSAEALLEILQAVATEGSRDMEHLDDGPTASIASVTVAP